MISLHPPLSGIPLSFVALLVVIEMLRWTRWGKGIATFTSFVVVATVVSTTAAFFSGYQAVSDLGEISEATEQLISQHHTIGRLLMFNAFALATSHWITSVAAHGKSFFHASYYFFLVVQLVLTMWAGYFGGNLVFEHAIGVKV